MLDSKNLATALRGADWSRTSATQSLGIIYKLKNKRPRRAKFDFTFQMMCNCYAKLTAVCVRDTKIPWSSPSDAASCAFRSLLAVGVLCNSMHVEGGGRTWAAWVSRAPQIPTMTRRPTMEYVEQASEAAASGSVPSCATHASDTRSAPWAITSSAGQQPHPPNSCDNSRFLLHLGEAPCWHYTSKLFSIDYCQTSEITNGACLRQASINNNQKQHHTGNCDRSYGKNNVPASPSPKKYCSVGHNKSCCLYVRKIGWTCLQLGALRAMPVTWLPAHHVFDYVDDGRARHQHMTLFFFSAPTAEAGGANCAGIPWQAGRLSVACRCPESPLPRLSPTGPVGSRQSKHIETQARASSPATWNSMPHYNISKQGLLHTAGKARG